ncbi:MAG: hypothetical protein JHD16_03565 [Solirubrobacteraceae bacterium]|nr:hypothetical protein [Solirubrobacteraceae bacterium]
MEQALKRPGSLAAIVALVGGIGFLLTGWLASLDHFIIDWRPFRSEQGLLFLGSFAQLVVAVAVWFQIRSADAQIAEERNRADQAREAREADLARVSMERRSDLRRLHRERQAEALIELVGSASNACSLYRSALRPLRIVVGTAGDSTALENARAEMALADMSRQAAHAARFRVRALCGDGQEYQAAQALVGVLDGQHSGGDAVVRWGLNPRRGNVAPDPRRVLADLTDEREACLSLASGLLTFD